MVNSPPVRSAIGGSSKQFRVGRRICPRSLQIDLPSPTAFPKFFISESKNQGPPRAYSHHSRAKLPETLLTAIMKVAQTLPIVALLASSAAATGWFPACAVCLSMSPLLDFKLTSMTSGTTAFQATMAQLVPPSLAGIAFAQTRALSTH